MHRSPWAAAAAALALLLATAAVHGGPPPENAGVNVRLDSDPLLDPDVVLEGEVLPRLEWNDDAPAFPGDTPGSLTARYHSSLPAGRIGWPLQRAWTQDDPFTALAVFVIEPDGFTADPFGFFQISWGLWNSQTTGMERTGRFDNFAGDTFELLEFDYFPNVSPLFGGPYLSPSLFGVADTGNPLFPFLGSFVNLTFGSVPLELPLGEPLMAVLEHRPAQRAVVVSVQRITADGTPLPLPGGVTVMPRSMLTIDEFSVDTVGLTLWRDGFVGPTPSLTADVSFHVISARPAVSISQPGAGGADGVAD